MHDTCRFAVWLTAAARCAKQRAAVRAPGKAQAMLFVLGSSGLQAFSRTNGALHRAFGNFPRAGFYGSTVRPQVPTAAVVNFKNVAVPDFGSVVMQSAPWSERVADVAEAWAQRAGRTKGLGGQGAGW